MSFEPPIQNLNKLDIVGERNDGGVDLVIVVSGPLDGSAATLSMLERKIRNYIAELSGSEFKQKYGQPKGNSNSIYVVSEYPVDALALGAIERLKPIAKKAGANLEFRRSME
jgi:hypothetical protein